MDVRDQYAQAAGRVEESLVLGMLVDRNDYDIRRLLPLQLLRQSLPTGFGRHPAQDSGLADSSPRVSNASVLDKLLQFVIEVGMQFERGPFEPKRFRFGQWTGIHPSFSDIQFGFVRADREPAFEL